MTAHISLGYGSKYIVLRAIDSEIQTDIVTGSLYDDLFRKHFLSYLDDLPESSHKREMMRTVQRIEKESNELKQMGVSSD